MLSHHYINKRAYPNYTCKHLCICIPHHLATEFLEVSDWHSTIVQLVVHLMQIIILTKQMYMHVIIVFVLTLIEFIKQHEWALLQYSRYTHRGHLLRVH